MKKTFFIYALFAVLCSSACSENQETATDTPVNIPEQTAQEEAPVSLTPLSDESGSEVLQPASPEPAAPQPMAGDAGLNPAHGQPGHRCDIPVGAPLNSPAGANAASAPMAAPSQMQVERALPPPTAPAASSTPGQASGKINPPHGQPGHDCAVPVGSPLP